MEYRQLQIEIHQAYILARRNLYSILEHLLRQWQAETHWDGESLKCSEIVRSEKLSFPTIRDGECFKIGSLGNNNTLIINTCRYSHEMSCHFESISLSMISPPCLFFFYYWHESRVQSYQIKQCQVLIFFFRIIKNLYVRLRMHVGLRSPH